MFATFLILTGLILLYYGADFLVKGASKLAAMLGVTPLLIGLTVVAFGTSMPELIVSLSANSAGKGDIALGNVVGSNIFNTAFILGLSALFNPLKVKVQLIRFDVPVMIAVSLLAFFFLKDNTVKRPEGIAFLLIITFYTLFNIYLGKRSKDDYEFKEAFGDLKKNTSLVRQIFLIAMGLGMLVAGAKALVSGSVYLARGIGVSEAVIGLTIVSAGTSLPELATSIIAAIKKEADIAIGNVVGSNIFNILGILGVCSMISPIKTAGIEPMDLYFMLGLAILSMPLMWSKYSISRKEGLCFLSLYLIYIYILIQR